MKNLLYYIAMTYSTSNYFKAICLRMNKQISELFFQISTERLCYDILIFTYITFIINHNLYPETT